MILSLTPSAPSNLWCSRDSIAPKLDEMSSRWSQSLAPHACAMSSAIGLSIPPNAKIPASAKECKTLESIPSAEKMTLAPQDFALSVIFSI